MLFRSPAAGLTAAEATVTLVGFVLVYAALLGLYVYVIARIIRNGPPGESSLRSVPDTPRSPSAPGAPGVADDD